MLLTASHPFNGTSVTEICASIVTTKARSLRDQVPTVPASLESIILRCLVRDKGERWPTARALPDALAAHGSAASP